MSNRIDVFTDELKKVWTILQQQQVMINAIKDNINAIEKNTTDIDNVNKVVPTDIDMDSNCKLVLKHDGQELTGQVKNVTNIIFIRFFGLDILNINTHNASKDENTKELINKIKALNYDNGNQNYSIVIYDNANGYVWYGEVYGINKDYNIKLFHIDTPDYVYISNLNYSETDDYITTEETGEFNIGSMLTRDNLKTIFGNQSLVGSGNIDLYRHHITANVQDLNIDFVYYSSNSLKIDSLQDLTKVTKGVVPGIVGYKDTQYYPLFLKYISNVWYVVGPTNLSTPIKVALTSISDEITTI